MTPATHYTEEPSRLSTRTDSTFTRVYGGGFVTYEMLEQTIQDLRLGEERVPAMLVDLTEMSGYDASCVRPAQQFLREAASLGLTRMAVVASSSVMRTASRVAAPSLPFELRIFEHGRHAEQWLHAPNR